MPHTTPARALIATCREYHVEKGILMREIETANLTPKQRLFNVHQCGVWKTHVAEALRAYVNDLLADEDMNRANLAEMPAMFEAYARAVTKARTKTPLREGVSQLAVICAFRCHRNDRKGEWFRRKTGGLKGFANVDNKNMVEFSGFGTRRRSVPIDGPVDVEKVAGTYTAFAPDVEFNTCPTMTGRGAQDVATQVLTGGPIYLRVTGAGSVLEVPRIGIDQELNAQLAILALFGRRKNEELTAFWDSIPLDLKQKIFWHVVIEPAMVAREHGRQRVEEIKLDF